MTTTPSSSSSLLFQRACTLQVADLLIPAGQGTGLDVSFVIKRGVKVTAGGQKPQPNTCDLKIWNLSPTHRKQLEQSTIPGAAGAATKIVPVIVTAGYTARQSVLFSGELRAAHSVTDGADIVTELSTGDGDQALTQQRLSIALGPGAGAVQGLQQLVAALGVGQGNVQKAIALLQATPLAAQLFVKGVCMKGAAADVMSEFCRSVGLDWSIQHGQLQFTALGQPVQGQAILLDADHGLIGSPTVDTKGILSCETEMIPDMAPGRALSLNAVTVQGGFRVLSVETKGDTFGNDWGHAIEAKRY